MATILLIGASRGIGLQTVRQALDAGHRVRAFARSAGSIAIEHPNLAKISADVFDDNALSQALEGVDVVIQTLGLKAGPKMIVQRTTFFSDATRKLLAAMKRTGIGRLVTVTGFGAGNSRNRGGPFYNLAFHLFLGRAYDDKDVQEKLIRESGLDWVIVRPVILFDGSHTGRYHVLLEPRRWRTGFISRADVADFLIKQIDDDNYLHKTPAITG